MTSSFLLPCGFSVLLQRQQIHRHDAKANCHPVIGPQRCLPARDKAPLQLERMKRSARRAALQPPLRHMRDTLERIAGKAPALPEY